MLQNYQYFLTLVEEKNMDVIAERIHEIVSDQSYKKNIIDGERNRLKDFSYEHIKEEILEEIGKVISNK